MISVEMDDLEREVNEEIEKARKKVRTAMQKAGEDYVGTSRTNGSYQDRTGLLRAANGYDIYEKDFKAVDASGHPDTAQMFENETMEADMTLIVGNGRDYCSFVEAKDYDVASSGFLAAERTMNELMNAEE